MSHVHIYFICELFSVFFLGRSISLFLRQSESQINWNELKVAEQKNVLNGMCGDSESLFWFFAFVFFFIFAVVVGVNFSGGRRPKSLLRGRLHCFGLYFLCKRAFAQCFGSVTLTFWTFLIASIWRP